MALPSTYYPNNSRTVSGVVSVFNDDVILLCNTSVAPVTINLNEIPDNEWNTVYKLYIVDLSGNALVNNITINAGVGQLVNGSASTIIGTNFGSAVIRIASNNQYLASFALGGTGGPVAIYDEGVLLTPNVAKIDFVGAGVTATAVLNDVTVNIIGGLVTLTFAQLVGLINSNTVVPGQNYLITDAIFGEFPAIPTGVVVQGITINKVSQKGEGIFYNADYQAVGNYSGVVGFVAQKGVWRSALVIVIGDVVIWNNYHYVNTTGVNGANNPSLDAVNWTLLPYSATNGYIIEVDEVSYEQGNNYILSRLDERLNYVERYSFGGVNSHNVFKWGSNQMIANQVQQQSIANLCNSSFEGFCVDNTLERSICNFPSASGSFIGNKFTTTNITIGNALSSAVSNNIMVNASLNIAVLTNGFTENFIENSSVVSATTLYNFTNNKLVSSNVDIDSSLSNFVTNDILSSSVTITSILITGQITNNQINFTNLVIGTIGGIFINNLFDNSTINVTNNGGQINYNHFQNGILNVSVVNNGFIEYNNVDSSTMEIATNNSALSIVRYNVLLNSSELKVTGVNKNKIWYNTITQFSKLIVGDNNSLIGDTAPATKGGGNVIANKSILDIGTNADEVYGNTIDGASSITITNNNASFHFNQTYACVYLITTNSLIIKNTNANGATLTLVNTAIIISGGYSTDGNGSIAYVLDCADPTIYDLATTTLTIPVGISNFFGIYTLLNAGGLTISKIVNNNTKYITTFYSDNGNVTFNSVVLAGILGNEIASTTAPSAFVVKAGVAPNLGDSILIRRLGTALGSYSAVEIANIYT